MRLSLLLVLLVCATGRAARAQIVNVLPRLSSLGEAGLGGDLSFTLAWKTGNTELLQLGASGVLAYRDAHDVLFVLASGTYAEQAETVFIEQTLAHARYRRRLASALELELFGQHEHDRQRRLAMRALAGIGPRLSFTWLGFVELALGTAYMIEHERYTGDGAAVLTQRSSSYVQGSAVIAERVRFESSLFVQPRFGAAGDYRLLGEAALVLDANDWIGSRTSLRVTRDSRPPLGVEPTDSTVETTLRLKL